MSRFWFRSHIIQALCINRNRPYSNWELGKSRSAEGGLCRAYSPDVLICLRVLYKAIHRLLDDVVFTPCRRRYYTVATRLQKETSG